MQEAKLKASDMKDVHRALFDMVSLNEASECPKKPYRQKFTETLHILKRKISIDRINMKITDIKT